ncbi:hypothetical protein [Glacieibacterium frigidum]|uniref:Uncharacterized protein n=1 Tax=Glacieibacterium frigidum TaxID=2593303 RepID=A0A552UHH3_9SPHN|nr:hypothetical protein [Glacieibacterium frigidum]TRW17637.1 hypothetical protein FMM06_05675 [Glacieibacterium frigidum]
MSDPARQFGDRLSLAMKLLNISQGALSSEARADKSLVSRWARGIAAPRGPYLAVLTGIVRARVPAFNQLSWDLPLDAFAALLGGEAPPPEPAPRPAAAPSDIPHSRLQSAVEVAREGAAYPGLYALFRVAFRNTGELLAELIVLWREGDRLFFRSFDPSFSHAGELFIIRHQLFSIAEDDARADGMSYWIVNGVAGQKAYRCDGIAMSVAGDRYRTPGATVFVLQRIAELGDDGAPPPVAVLTAISARMKAAYVEGRIDDLAGPRICAAIRSVVGVPRVDGTVDHHLRQPMERSLSVSEVELSPDIAADIDRVCADFTEGSGAVPLAYTRISA